MFVLLYVDDMLLISKSLKMVGSLKKKLNTAFDMKDLGPTRKILGILLLEIGRNICISCIRNLIWKIMLKFGNVNCKHVSLPLSAHHILSEYQCPKSKSEMLRMEQFLVPMLLDL